MKPEKELKEDLKFLRRLGRESDTGIINLNTAQRNRIKRKIEFLEELLA